MNPDSRKIRMILELRSWGVTDKRVLSAMERTPRDLFVPEAFRDRAFANVALPIGHHQTISRPQVVGLMSQALAVGPRMKVLEIGTGCGYQSVVLSSLCRRLYSMEVHKNLQAGAEARFAALGITNITLKTGDGSLGWPEQAPFERIIVTAAAADIPPVLAGQLAVGGLMVVPIGEGHDDQRLVRVERTNEGFETEDLGAVRFVTMVEGMPERNAVNG